MRRVKSKIVAQKRKTASDLIIEERIAAAGRGERSHIVYLGEMVERVMRGEFGAILKALTAGRIDQELQANRTNGISSERILGRCEMASNLIKDLEQYVIDKDKLMVPLKEETPSDQQLAESPIPFEEQFQ